MRLDITMYDVYLAQKTRNIFIIYLFETVTAFDGYLAQETRNIFIISLFET